VKLFTCRRIHDNGNSVTIKVGGMFLTRWWLSDYQNSSPGRNLFKNKNIDYPYSLLHKARDDQ
jgi:hypothetical protein